MPDQQTQTKEKELPYADLETKKRAIQDLMGFVLGNNAAKLTVDENDNINLKTNYAPTAARNLQAQIQATEQAGLPSYGGIDPEMVLQLMGQRSAQDARFAQSTPNDMQGIYQGALARQAMGADSRQLRDIAAKFASQLVGGDISSDLQSQQDAAAMDRLDKQVKAQEAVAKIGAGGKDPAAIQRADEIAAMVYDKTGDVATAKKAKLDYLQGNITNAQLETTLIKSMLSGSSAILWTPERASKMAKDIVKELRKGEETAAPKFGDLSLQSSHSTSESGSKMIPVKVGDTFQGGKVIRVGATTVTVEKDGKWRTYPIER